MMLPVILVALFGVAVNGHTYKLGDCPKVEPVHDFEMNKFLGKWYVIQKTKTSSHCLTYNFTDSAKPNEYDLEQVSENHFLGRFSRDKKFHYTGHLTVPSLDSPAKMVVQFAWNVIGTASFTVFSTDYDTYGAIFTCQKLPIGHRQSATIFSRKKFLDTTYLDKIRQKLSTFEVDTNDLRVIEQSSCSGDNTEENDERKIELLAPNWKLANDDYNEEVSSTTENLWLP